MEKLPSSYDKEYMRMAMLKHEETFKEQVYELHRLYRIQKILMKNMQSRSPEGRSSQELWTRKNGFSGHHHYDAQQDSRTKLDLERRPAAEYIADSNGDHGVLEGIDESEIELTLGPSCYSTRRKKPETPMNSDSAPSFSSSSTGSSHINRTTSSLRTNATREESGSGGGGRRELRLAQVPDMAMGYQTGSKNSVDLEEQLRQERLKQPPWLFQVLSLNMT